MPIRNLSASFDWASSRALTRAALSWLCWLDCWGCSSTNLRNGDSSSTAWLEILKTALSTRNEILYMVNVNSLTIKMAAK